MNVEHKYPFQTCGEFEDMFGAHPQLDGYESASNVNVDMRQILFWQIRYILLIMSGILNF